MGKPLTSIQAKEYGEKAGKAAKASGVTEEGPALDQWLDSFNLAKLYKVLFAHVHQLAYLVDRDWHDS
jgi:hypothetical protein